MNKTLALMLLEKKNKKPTHAAYCSFLFFMRLIKKEEKKIVNIFF